MRARPDSGGNLTAKRCTGCGAWRDVAAFWRNRARADGLQDRCIPCQRAHNRDAYFKARERARYAAERLADSYVPDAKANPIKPATEGGRSDRCPRHETRLTIGTDGNGRIVERCEACR